jgi:two-component system, OmpR family, phosphate regulon response regulator PhoB
MGDNGAQTVLVADDDPDLVALVARRLVRAGYRVITASDGEQALQLVEQFLPELAVLDVMMPELTGIDVVGRLRAHAATRDVRIILISAGFSDNVASRGPPAGADDYIKKPFGVLEIPDRVQAVLAR